MEYYEEVQANDLKPGDELANQGKIKSVKLTTKEVAIVMYSSIPKGQGLVLGSLQETPSMNETEIIFGYKEKMVIVKRAVNMVDLAVHEFGQRSHPAVDEPKKENK